MSQGGSVQNTGLQNFPCLPPQTAAASPSPPPVPIILRTWQARYPGVDDLHTQSSNPGLRPWWLIQGGASFRRACRSFWESSPSSGQWAQVSSQTRCFGLSCSSWRKATEKRVLSKRWIYPGEMFSLSSSDY